jgi:hypothetical protein
MTDIDTTAAKMPDVLDQVLNRLEISLVFAETNYPVRAKIER